MAQVANIEDYEHLRQPRLVMEYEEKPRDFMLYKSRHDCEMTAGIYSVMVNHSIIGLELAGIKLYDEVHIRISDNMTLIGPRKVQLRTVGDVMPTAFDDIINVLHYDELRAATRAELFAFAVKMSRKARLSPIVALGSVAFDAGGRKAMVLKFVNGKPLIMWEYCEYLPQGIQLLVGYKPYA